MSDEVDIRLELNGETAALLAHAIRAQGGCAVKIGYTSERFSETLRYAASEEQRTKMAARLLAAAHNPYRDGAIRIHIWGEIPDCEGRIDYCCGNPYDERLPSAASLSAATTTVPIASAASSRA